MMFTGHVRGWERFEPWLTRLETMPAETVWAAADRHPSGMVWRRHDGDGSAGGEAAGAAQPDPGAD